MMHSERFWVVVLGGVCFLSGLAGGVLVAPRLDPSSESGPFAAYETRFAEEFGLDQEQRQDLRHVLARYLSDVEELKARQMDGLEPELVKLGLVCRDRIRKYVVPAERRSDFDRLAGGPSPETARAASRSSLAGAAAEKAE